MYGGHVLKYLYPMYRTGEWNKYIPKLFLSINCIVRFDISGTIMYKQLRMDSESITLLKLLSMFDISMPPPDENGYNDYHDFPLMGQLEYIKHIKVVSSHEK